MRIHSLRFSALGIFALAAATTACVAPGVGDGVDGEQVGAQRSAVQGGKADVTHNFAVGIVNRFGGVCSGTLIAPNLVLTARHCVDPPSEDRAVTCNDSFPPAVEPSALFVTTSSSLSQTASFYRATDIITPAATSFCGNDIALIILEANVPEKEARPATPVVQFSLTDARLSGRITAMGYGITSPSAEDSGQRRIRQNIPLLCIPGSRSLECSGELAQFSESDREFVSEGYVCSGDSGGGAFDQKSFDAGEPYVMGALSRGPQTADRCLAAVYSRTDAHKEMIVRAGLDAANKGHYPPPEWTKAPPAETSIPPIGETVCVGETCTETIANEPAATASPATITTTTTSGCSTSRASSTRAWSTRESSAHFALALGIAAALVSRRRRARVETS